MKCTSRRGSVLLEGVIVLPLWLIVFGGVMILGFRGADVLRVKGAERYAAEGAVKRKGAAGPSLPLMATAPFRGRGLARCSQERWVAKEIAEKARSQKVRPYLMLVAGKSSLASPSSGGLFADMMAQPLYGIGKDWRLWDEITSSRKRKSYTNYLIVRTQHSAWVRRHWDASMVYDLDVWQYKKKEDGDNTYPKDWSDDSSKMSRYDDPAPQQISDGAYKKHFKDVYERLDSFVDWSGEAHDR